MGQRTKPREKENVGYTKIHACSANLTRPFWVLTPPQRARGVRMYSMHPTRRPVNRTTQKTTRDMSSHPTLYLPELGS